MENRCPAKHLPYRWSTLRNGSRSGRGGHINAQLRDDVVERRGPVVHEPFEALQGDVYPACERRALLAGRVLADDACMAEVLLFGRLSKPVSPGELNLDDAERLVARVVPEVLDENTPREGREVDRPCSPPV